MDRDIMFTYYSFTKHQMKRQRPPIKRVVVEIRHYSWHDVIVNDKVKRAKVLNEMKALTMYPEGEETCALIYQNVSNILRKHFAPSHGENNVSVCIREEIDSGKERKHFPSFSFFADYKQVV